MKKIAVFTGTRAEYGLLSHLLHELRLSPEVELKLIVGGTHLSSVFGNTYQQILADGFVIDEKIDYLMPGTSPVDIAASVAKAIDLSSQVLSTMAPDCLVLLGDRYEVLALAQSALILNIPVAHIHGGEITEGAIDDAIRHSVSKMAHIHFVAAEEYRNRLIQMGEQPASIHNVGAPGLDNLDELSDLSLEELSQYYQFDFTAPYFLITYHPETLSSQDQVSLLQELLTALQHFPKYKLVFTYPNADAYGEALLACLKDFQVQMPNVLLLSSMGRKHYLSAVKHAQVVLGNSSSGIIEAPSLKVPTVNIGNRQKGRLAAKSVIHCDTDAIAIKQAIESAIALKKNGDELNYHNPYGGGNASKQIADILETHDFNKSLAKSFYQLGTT